MKNEKFLKDDNMKQTDNSMDVAVGNKPAKKPEARGDVNDKTAEEAKVAKIEATAAAQKAGNESKSNQLDSSGEKAGDVNIPESPLSVHNADGDTDIDTKINAQKEKLNKLTDNPNNQDPKIVDLNKEQDIESRGGDEDLLKIPAPAKSQANQKADLKGDVQAKAKPSGNDDQPEAKGTVPKVKEDAKTEDDGEVNAAATEHVKGKADDKAPKSENKTEAKQKSENADEDVRNENADAPQY